MPEYFEFQRGEAGYALALENEELELALAIFEGEWGEKLEADFSKKYKMAYADTQAIIDQGVSITMKNWHTEGKIPDKTQPFKYTFGVINKLKGYRKQPKTQSLDINPLSSEDKILEKNDPEMYEYSHVTWQRAMKRISAECKEVLVFLHSEGLGNLGILSQGRKIERLRSPNGKIKELRNQIIKLKNIRQAEALELDLIYEAYKSQGHGSNEIDKTYDWLRQKVTRCAKDMVEKYCEMRQKYPSHE